MSWASIGVLLQHSLEWPLTQVRTEFILSRCMVSPDCDQRLYVAGVLCVDEV